MVKINQSLFTSFKKLEEYKNLTELQKKFFKDFFSGRNIFLTGPAGTGKSYCVNLLYKFLDLQGIFYGKTATTGVAALNIGGTTLHSWSGMGLADDNGMDLLDKVSENKKACNRIKNSAVLIIDEISMAKSELVDKLDIVCQYIRNKGKPFGGIQMVFVGDFMQLPPVFKNFEQESFAFESQAWREACVKTLHLTEIVRQHDEPHFAKLLNEVRMGQAKDYTLLMACVDRKFPNDGIKPVKLYCKNLDVSKFNHDELHKIKSDSKFYHATDNASESWQQFFDKNCPAPTDLELREGAQVILLVNLDVKLGLVNGSVGTVTKLYDNCVDVNFACGPQIIEVHKWEIKQNEFDSLTGKMKKVVLASRTQLPLKLAWALTIHKCLEENSVIHLKNSSKMIRNVGNDYTYSAKNSYNKIEKTHRMTNQDAIKITLRSGKEIICSPNHKIGVAYSLTNVAFEEAFSIKEDDAILSKKGFPTPEKSPISTELCWLLGALVGDGSYSQASIDRGDYRVDFTNIPSECGDIYKKLTESLLNVKVSVTKSTNNKAKTFYFHNKGAREYLTSLGLTPAIRENKRVPMIIFECGRVGIANFICGLIDSDGHINRKNIVITNVAKQMLLETQTLLEILGYRSYVAPSRTHCTKNQNIPYQLQIYAHEARRFLVEFSKYLKAVGKYKHLSTLMAYPYKKNKVQINDFPLSDSEVELLKGELKTKFGKPYGKSYRLYLPSGLSDFLSRNRRGLDRFVLERMVREIPNFAGLGPVAKAIDSAITSNLFVDSVISVEPFVNQTLVDITLDKEHTYFANGVLHHNCQGATLDRAEVDVSEAFAAGQVYVALSRVRNLGSLKLLSFSPHRIKTNQKCVDFYNLQEEEKEIEFLIEED